MFKPISLAIGLRYTRAKRRNHFISFISMTSMLGIGLGVLVLITVLSVMNGFDKEISKSIFRMVPEITVMRFPHGITKWQDLRQKLLANQSVVRQAAPFIGGEALITGEMGNKPAIVYGITPSIESTLTELGKSMVNGALSDLKPKRYGIVLGKPLADSLGVGVHDKILLFTPDASITPMGAFPRLKQFTVVGVFRTGGGFDRNFAYINLKDAQVLYRMGKAVTGLRLRISDPYQAPMMVRQLIKSLPSSYQISDWTEQYGSFFQAVSMEKTMMFLILLLIIAVAAFNLVSTLVMAVNEKESDIAILRTLGATPRVVMMIFIVQGTLIGFIGTFLGVVGGIALSLHVTELAHWIQQMVNQQLISSDVYFINYLPSELQWRDVYQVTIIALSLSFLATLYPAWRAFRVQPAEALRYE
jgi:lipoprotein-releasing system permease protein